MRLLDFLSPSSESDTPESDNALSRRDAVDRLRKLGLGAAALSLPFALVGRPRVARAQSMGDPVAILNYALTLEYLEASYYRQGLDATLEGGDTLINGDARTIYGQIAAHEDAHVTVLADTIDQLGGTPVEFADEDFDFTAGGAFDPFGDYATFLLLSQAFEDTGVRAYKGQAAALAGNELLTPALQIHSVEARHAAEVRRLRAEQGASLKPWITRAESGSAPAAVYADEDTTVQAGVDQTMLGDYTLDAITEAYDEPLTMDAVAGENSIATPFLA
jgi:rubrerythrin